VSGDWVVIEPADLMGGRKSGVIDGHERANISPTKKPKVKSDEGPDGNGTATSKARQNGDATHDNATIPRHVLVSSLSPMFKCCPIQTLSPSTTLPSTSTTQKLFNIRKNAKSSKNVCILLLSILQLTTVITVKEKYGSDFDEDFDEDDSESDESEDENGEELTPNVDAAILRTLARIKRKDPAIYNTDKNIFVGMYAIASSSI